MSDWISVEDELPAIPEDKYGVHVIVAAFDSVFEEINPGHGYSVYEYGYTRTIGRDGKVRKGYEGTTLDADFMEFTDDGYALPSGDPITHWQHKPEPPNV